MEFKPSSYEEKWRNQWHAQGIYNTPHDTTRPKYYILDMFPYPSGAGLHVGHPLGYTATDILARYKRMNGFNVLHPMGFDSFGLPAEQYALQQGVHPAITTEKNARYYREQLDKLGFSFDWSRTVDTSNPEFYKWTQWIVTLLFKHYYNKNTQKAATITELIQHFEQHGTSGLNAATNAEDSFTAAKWKAFSPKQKDEILMHYRLAYRSVGFVNWCEELGTVLANDEIKDGKSERGGFPVTKKEMPQWNLRMTAYADRLLQGLEGLDWSESMKTTQRNWIGRSEGALVDFQFADKDGSLRVFTTRPDTIFGVTYMVVAPEHELIPALTTAEQKTAVEAYVTYVKSRSEVERMADKRVSGVFTGSYCKHPFTNENIPIWTSEYVLAGYGTGAIMAVPSDDERDMAFAKHFDIPIIEVVDKSKYPDATLADKIGVIINSDFLNGLEVKDAIAKANEVIEARGFGKAKVNFKLRDANMTRQRYWGEPMPIIYRPDGTTEALSADELPLKLPELADFKPTGDGTGPLSKLTDWVNLPDGSRRETDTMPGFAGSSWYFLRYMDAKNDTEFVSKEAVEYWQNVDFYLGGTEHATGHLLYSRMWNNFLYDLGYTPTAEPFQRLFNQGMIQGRALLLAVRNSDGTTRNLYVPIETANDKDQLTPSAWQTLKQDARFADIDDANIDFMENGNIQLTIEITKMSKSKFNVVNPDDIVRDYGADCLRMFEMFLGPLEMSKPWDTKGIKGVEGFLRKFWTLFFEKETLTLTDTPATKDEQKVLHTCIKRVREDIERLSLNTCVSHFMIATNDLKKLNCNKREILVPMVQLLAPFAPFMCEELWSLLGNTTSIHLTDNYPQHNEAFLIEDAFEYAVQVNGKLRATILLSATETADDIQEKVVALPEVQKWLNGNPPKKVILVPKKLVNVVG